MKSHFLLLFLGLSYLGYYQPSFVGDFFPEFFTILWFLQCFVFYFIYEFVDIKKISTPFLIIFFGTCFFVNLSSAPIFEDDYFRYFWDGWMVSQLKNPYSAAPLNLSPPENLGKIWEQINYPHLTTIYPPVAQLFFGFLVLISFKSFVFFKIILGTSSLIALFLSKKVWDKFELPNSLKLILLWGAHPIILKEWTNSLHYDHLMVSFIFLSLLATTNIQKSLCLGFAGATKYIALLIFPFTGLPWNIRTIGIVVISFLLAWPFFGDPLQIVKSFIVFSQSWEWNRGLFELIRLIVGPHFSRMASGLIIISIWLYYAKKCYHQKSIHFNSLFIFLFFLVAISPVANTWYFSWSILLLPLCSQHIIRFGLISYPWIGLSYLMYSKKIPHLWVAKMWTLEGMIIGLLFFLFLVRPKIKKLIA